MTLLQQQRLAKLRAQLDRNLDKRDQTIEWLIRVSANIKTLTKSISRLEKRMAAAPKLEVAPAVITPPPPVDGAILDDSIPDFLRRSKQQSGETKRMPLEGKDALKAIFG